MEANLNLRLVASHFISKTSKHSKRSQFSIRDKTKHQNIIMCSATGMTRLLAKKRVIDNAAMKKLFAATEKTTPVAQTESLDETFEDSPSSRFDSIAFSESENSAPSIPCQERHCGCQSMDRVLREELASPEGLTKPRRRCSLYCDSPFDNMFAESDHSGPLAMPRRSIS